ncbi:DUF4304 domain-containing protein [Clostridiaceae bacterium M8S5]|nr:DUF4304 domain-containing protein [Clostridiaceae bacterium M8S5]
MSQRQEMIASLKEHVIPLLEQQGFSGDFPHYKRDLGNRIELLMFYTYKCGGAFNIEISTAFTDCEKELTNYYTEEFQSLENITVYSTIKRYRLKGMFDGWFYYTDVYKSKKRYTRFRTYYHYESVGEKKSKNFIPSKDQILVQKSDSHLYTKISSEVNRQMKSAYNWWSKYSTPNRMKRNKWSYI